METTNNFNNVIERVMNGEKGLSFSSLKEFLKSPRHYWAYNQPKETTKAMNEGTMFHMAVLEPEKFKENYWVLDDSEKIIEIGGKSPRATKLYKEWKSEEVAKHKGECIAKELYDTFVGMNEYLMVNEATKHLMSGLTEKEKSFEFIRNGFKVVGKIDGVGILEKEKYTLDLKKVANASFDKLRWVIKDMRYHMQGSIYGAAEGCNNHYLICIDLASNVTVIKYSEETLNVGFAEFDFALDKFRECAEEDKFFSSYEFYNNGYIQV